MVHSFTEVQEKKKAILLWWKNLNINNNIAKIEIHTFHFYPCFLLFLPFLWSSRSWDWYCNLLNYIFLKYVYTFVFMVSQHCVASKFTIYSWFYKPDTILASLSYPKISCASPGSTFLLLTTSDLLVDVGPPVSACVPCLLITCVQSLYSNNSPAFFYTTLLCYSFKNLILGR